MQLTIRINNGSDEETRIIEAVPVGRNPLFAVHRAYDWAGKYRISHIPTGYRMPGLYPTKSAARAAAAEMTALFRPYPEWGDSSLTVDAVTTWSEQHNDEHGRLREIIRPYVGPYVG